MGAPGGLAAGVAPPTLAVVVPGRTAPSFVTPELARGPFTELARFAILGGAESAASVENLLDSLPERRGPGAAALGTVVRGASWIDIGEIGDAARASGVGDLVVVVARGRGSNIDD